MDNLTFDKKRFRIKQCPCGKSNKDGKFVPYIGFETHGYCHSCGKTFIPDKDSLPQAPNAYLYKRNTVIASEAKQSPDTRQIASVAKSSLAMTTPSSTVIARRNDEAISRLKQRDCFAVLAMTHSTHPFELVNQSCTGYEQNNFAVYLTSIAGKENALKALKRYHVGSSKHWQGATVFWQIDRYGAVRAGKIMLYHSPTGKRVKQPYNHITWVHRVLKLNNYNLKQCFFGEHLLRHDILSTIAIVESEKTAIVASIFLPQFIWLAAGSVSNLTKEKCGVLRNRNVVLFPDGNAYDKWTATANELSPIARFKVSNLLELNAKANDKINGLDLADYAHSFAKRRHS